MKKTIMGALCAIALSLGMTSCNDNPTYVLFEDVKEVTIHFDDFGQADDYYALITIEGVDDIYTIDPDTYKLLTDPDRKPLDNLCFESRFGTYSAYISHAHNHTIKLN